MWPKQAALVSVAIGTRLGYKLRVEILRTLQPALNVLAAVLSWLVVRRDSGHRWMAAYVTFMAAEHWLRQLFLIIETAAPAAVVVTTPLDHLVVLSWSLAFAACCVHYFVGRWVWAVMVVLGLLWSVRQWYPGWTADHTMTLMRGVGNVTLVFAWVLIIWGVLRKHELRPRLAHLVLILYAACDVVTKLVPLRRGYFENWPLVRLATVLMLLAICAAHARWLILARRRAVAVEA